MPEINIIDTPPEESEVTWESALSEIRGALSDGFNSLRDEFRSQMQTVSQSNSDLLNSNTRLTEMIASNNTALMERVTMLTPPPPPEVVVIVPPTDTPSLDESVIDPLEAAPDSPVERRKRRTL